MQAKELFGPSTLERYAECPYRWFVDRELEPRRPPPSDPLSAGSVAHMVLEKLYVDPPADDRAPTTASWTPGSGAPAS